MTNRTPKLGIGIAVVMLAVGGIYGVRMSGRAAGEGGAPAGCGGADPGTTTGATASAATAQDAYGTPINPADPAWAPYAAAGTTRLGPLLAAANLNPTNIKAVKGWYDGNGTTRIYFRQVHNGVPVLGGEALVQLGADMVVQKTEQQFVDIATVGAGATVAQEKATQVATSEMSCSTCRENCAVCLVGERIDTAIAYQVVDGALQFRVTAKGTTRDGSSTDRACLVHVQTGRSTCATSAGDTRMVPPPSLVADPSLQNWRPTPTAPIAANTGTPSTLSTREAQAPPTGTLPADVPSPPLPKNPDPPSPEHLQ